MVSSLAQQKTLPVTFPYYTQTEHFCLIDTFNSEMFVDNRLTIAKLKNDTSKLSEIRDKYRNVQKCTETGQFLI